MSVKETISSAKQQYKKIRTGGDIDTRTIAKMCEVLGVQPGDLLEYVKEDAR